MTLNAGRVDMFPARAGMSRNRDMSAEIQQYVPRASGDEPLSHDASDDKIKCSPRERG